MTLRLPTWLLLLCFALLYACGPEQGDTSILLTVNSDLSIPSEIDRVALEGASFDNARQPSADLQQKPLPRSIELRHESGPYGPLRVTVNAYRGSALVAQRTVQTFFVQGFESFVQVSLTRSCLQVFCADGLTCDNGSCAPIPTLTGTTELPADAGAESAPFDGHDAAARGDAGGEAGTALESDLRDGGIPSQDASSTLRDAALANDAAAPASDAGQGAANDAGIPKDSAVPPTTDAGANPPGGDAGGVSDAATPKDAAIDATAPSDAAMPLPDSAAPGPGARPTCSISKPNEGERVLVGASLTLLGSCSDAESGNLTTGLFWTSQLDGLLATGAAATATLRSAGTHTLRLCAADPRDEKLIGCASVQLSAYPAPTARITSVRQGGEDGDFNTLLPIVFQGAGTGTDVTLRWSDSLQGAIGMGAGAVLMMPLPGKHVVTLEVTDAFGNKATATRSFSVSPVMPPRGG